MGLIILFAAVWLACGVIAAGVMFASWQRRYPMLRADEFNADRWFAIFCILTGPFALFASCIMPFPTFSCGWLWPWSAKARIEAGRPS